MFPAINLYTHFTKDNIEKSHYEIANSTLVINNIDYPLKTCHIAIKPTFSRMNNGTNAKISLTISFDDQTINYARFTYMNRDINNIDHVRYHGDSLEITIGECLHETMIHGYDGPPLLSYPIYTKIKVYFTDKGATKVKRFLEHNYNI